MFVRQRQSKLLIFFLACVVIDIASMNAWHLGTTDEQQTRIYLLGQSFSFLCYITYIHILSRYIFRLIQTKPTFALKLASMNWIAFAASDLIETIAGTEYDVSVWEWVGLLIFIPLTIVEFRRKWKAL